MKAEKVHQNLQPLSASLPSTVGHDLNIAKVIPCLCIKGPSRDPVHISVYRLCVCIHVLTMQKLNIPANHHVSREETHHRMSAFHQ
jgi:hypothetical protein